jgi:hypothetical protein
MPPRRRKSQGKLQHLSWGLREVQRTGLTVHTLSFRYGAGHQRAGGELDHHQGHTFERPRTPARYTPATPEELRGD